MSGSFPFSHGKRAPIFTFKPNNGYGYCKGETKWDDLVPGKLNRVC